MSLYVIATPIGDPKDITLRALEILERAALVIGEDTKNTSRFLKTCKITGKEIYELNEHSKQKDVQELVDLCENQEVALISDCGTPGFCDPGAHLVHLCRRKKIEIYSVPGASSLMSFLSICGHRLDQFFFRGFLPAENNERTVELNKLRALQIPIIVMDTPYRLKKLLTELQGHFPQAKILLGTELTTPNETIYEGTAKSVLQNLKVEKAEFILCLLP
jgi:16S rRNA (cytidine1402-2'-O)-methyltransferase